SAAGRSPPQPPAARMLATTNHTSGNHAVAGDAAVEQVDLACRWPEAVGLAICEGTMFITANARVVGTGRRTAAVCGAPPGLVVNLGAGAALLVAKLPH